MASTDEFRHYWTDEITSEDSEAFDTERHLYASRTSGTSGISAAEVQGALFRDVSLRQAKDDAQFKKLVKGRWMDLRFAIRRVSESFFNFFPEEPSGVLFNALTLDRRIRISNAISGLPEYNLGGITTKEYTRWLWDNRMKAVKPSRAEEAPHAENRSDMRGQGSARQQLNMERQGNMHQQSDMWRSEGNDYENYTLPPLRGRHPHAGDYY
ncbi:hypothetical protein AOL_s00091g27 [Orbilia oligospora ATCC 24927]|uniref:Uncharacterized protein n=1 Tax=Arthrobotrys oligospora (strain ATCC 24927 / CBS 115.81 / DSM 1491) TaxID=756982 RepID=G1XHX5_ARTOA|nr:hypothetical protein AOL_s00091g27 [Orbilia oligospora ATCC 24927]EGX47206.1 hypothetical protein AOL_s00091g27 [Orbilia oligospora ATCC 24927]